MPAAIAHYLLAQRVRSDSIFQNPASACENAFLWGAQGPDFFFPHRFFFWQKGENLRALGDRLHATPPAEIFDFGQALLQKENDPVLRFYLAGFLCHYALDSTAHPFIQFGAQELHPLIVPSTIDTCHNEIEANLDVILLRYERGELPTDFSLKQTVPKDETVQKAVSEFFPLLAETLYGMKISAELVVQAMDDCRRAVGGMTDRTTLKKKILTRIEKNKIPNLSCHVRSMTEETDFDYANVLHAQWQWPLDTGELRTDSFLDLFEQAAGYAETLIGVFLSGKSVAPLVEERSFEKERHS